MNIVLNGCGRVGKALLQHWKNHPSDVHIAAIRRSDRQWINHEKRTVEEIDIEYLDFQEPLQGIDEFLDQQTVDIWFELTPTDLNRASDVHTMICKVLEKNIHVIFANKAPVLHDYVSLKQTADAHGVRLGLSAVMGASLPSYALAHYGALGSRILSMKGILNGTTNFILAEMEQGKSFEQSLDKALQIGIAEPKWQYDIDGIDSAVKMSILASVVTNKNVPLDMDQIKGIRTIDQKHIQELEKNQKRYKLVASFKEGTVSVQPEVFSIHELFYHVNGSDKVLYLETDTLSNMSVLGGKSGLKEVAASMHRDLQMITQS